MERSIFISTVGVLEQVVLYQEYNPPTYILTWDFRGFLIHRKILYVMYIPIRIYLYIYVCVCVCVCMWAKEKRNGIKRRLILIKLSSILLTPPWRFIKRFKIDCFYELENLDPKKWCSAQILILKTIIQLQISPAIALFSMLKNIKSIALIKILLWCAILLGSSYVQT